MAKSATPAARVRAKRDPAIFQPPPRIRGDLRSSIRNLSLRSAGRVYPVGANIEGDPPWSMGMDQTAQVTLQIRDVEDRLIAVLDDETHLQQDGIRTTIDGVVYVVSGIDCDGEGMYTLTMEDEVSWRLKQFTSFKSASRARTTRFGFIQTLVDEAQRKPLGRMRSWIPEVDDKLKIRKPEKDKT